MNCHMLIQYTSRLKKLTLDNLCGQPYIKVIHCRNLEQNQGSMIYAYCVSSTLLNAKGCIIHVKYYLLYRMCYAWNSNIALKRTRLLRKELEAMDKNVENGNIDFDYWLSCMITIIFVNFPLIINIYILCGALYTSYFHTFVVCKICRRLKLRSWRNYANS